MPVLSSFSTNLLPSLELGADGILSGHGSVIADLHAQLLAAVRAGKREDARVVYYRVQLMTGAVYRPPMADMYTRMKEQLVQLGRIRRATVRPPLAVLDDAERDVLRRSLASAGLIESPT